MNAPMGEKCKSDVIGFVPSGLTALALCVAVSSVADEALDIAMNVNWGDHLVIEGDELDTPLCGSILFDSDRAAATRSGPVTKVKEDPKATYETALPIYHSLGETRELPDGMNLFVAQ